MSTTLYIPVGNYCAVCPAYYCEYETPDEDSSLEYGFCGLAAMWGEGGTNPVQVSGGQKSKACLEETRLSPITVQSLIDPRRRRNER